MRANHDPLRLIHPKSIVFIGGNECAIGIRRCQEFGFPGKIYAVHPKRDEIAGIRTLKSVNEIDGPIDAAFIAVKREPTIELVRDLRAKGCGGAVIYASGFAETGDHALQDQLLAAADGMPLMGPNCYGFVNGLARAALWPDEHGIKPIERGIAIISQSGNIACNMTFTRRALPLAAVFTIGNQVDVDMAKMVDFLSADDRITAIGLHVEGLPDVAAFAAACEQARLRGKPVVMLKTGRSEQGAAVAMSHTSSLAGADSLYDALAARYGVARVHSITAFVETLKFLHTGSLRTHASSPAPAPAVKRHSPPTWLWGEASPCPTLMRQRVPGCAQRSTNMSASPIHSIITLLSGTSRRRWRPLSRPFTPAVTMWAC